jgi:hypothetical protein
MSMLTRRLSHQEIVSLDRNYAEVARIVNLTYVNDSISGIHRIRKGKGFAYVDDSKKSVKEEVFNDHSVYVYKVKGDVDNLIAYNKLVAVIIGRDIDNATLNILKQSAVKSGTIYIDKASKQVLKTVSKDGTGTSIVTFSDFGATRTDNKPTATLTWDEFEAGKYGTTPLSVEEGPAEIPSPEDYLSSRNALNI